MAVKTTSPRQSDIAAAITQPKTNSVAEKASKANETVRYNIDGLSDAGKKKKHLDVDSCAVEFQAGRNRIYKVKTNKLGKLFDPRKVGQNYSLKAPARGSQEPMFVFREVTKVAFDSYVRFLQKRIETLLLIAEREVK